MVPRPGFEPGARARKLQPSSQMPLNMLWSLHKEAYQKWLSLRVATEETKRRYPSTLEKFFSAYTIQSYEDLQEALMSVEYKRHITKALRSFVNFLKSRGVITREQHLDLKEIIWTKPVQPRKVNVSDEQIRAALEYYEQKDATLATIYKALVYSGLRLRAVIELFNEYDPEKLILPPEHENIAKYPLHRHKGQKKAFYAYLPRDFALSEIEQLPLDYEHVKNRLRVKLRAVRNTEKSVQFSASAVREWFATFLARQGCPFEVINFIQGRAERGVLEKHYLNLEILADEWYSAVVDDLKAVLEGEK